MRPPRAWTEREPADPTAHDDGSAAIEFVFVGLILLVPIVYLIVALGAIQEHALGVEAGARHIARSIAAATDSTDAAARADDIVAAISEEYGMDAAELAVSVRCRPAGRTCPEAGATVLVTVTAEVALPLIPPVLGLDRIVTVPVEAVGVQKVSQYGGSE